MSALSVAPHARYPRLPAVASQVRLETDPASSARQIPPGPRRAYAGFKMRNRLSLLLRQPATLDVGLAVLLAGLSVLTVWRLIDPAGLNAVPYQRGDFRRRGRASGRAARGHRR